MVSVCHGQKCKIYIYNVSKARLQYVYRPSIILIVIPVASCEFDGECDVGPVESS